MNFLESQWRWLLQLNFSLHNADRRLETDKSQATLFYLPIYYLSFWEFRTQTTWIQTNQRRCPWGGSSCVKKLTICHVNSKHFQTNWYMRKSEVFHNNSNPILLVVVKARGNETNFELFRHFFMVPFPSHDCIDGFVRCLMLSFLSRRDL